jgi:hypothetical protein
MVSVSTLIGISQIESPKSFIMRNEGERLLYLRGKGYAMPEKGYTAQPDNGTDFALWAL